MAGRDRVKGVKRYQHPVSGIWYCYHRKTNKRIVAEWRTADFFIEVAALDAAVKAREPPPGSLGGLIKAYRESPAWDPLKPKTRFSYERVFAAIADLHEIPVTKLTRPAIFKIRDQKIYPKRGRWMANYFVTVLALLLDYATDHDWIDANPLEKKVKRIRAAKDDVPKNRPWSGEECTIVLETARPHIRVPIALAMFGGFRKEDTLTMTRAKMKDGMVTVRTSKRDVNVDIPIHPALQDALDAQEAALAKRGKPRNEVHIALNSFGEKWTESGFNSSWSKLRNRLLTAGKVSVGLTFHGLRHTLGTRLKEAGASDQEIMDILGQRSPSMAKHYSEGAEMPEKTKGLVLSINVRKNKKG
ncbi:MAG: integrase [Hyphomicrobiales bacterium]|nr:integrase [Hyphomicrobiales bacterium]